MFSNQIFKGETMDKKDILIVIILIGSAILGIIPIMNGVYNSDNYRLSMTIILILVAIICIVYLITKYVMKSDKLNSIGKFSPVLCIGVIVVVFALAGISSTIDHYTLGYSELEEADLHFISSGGTVETGYWVYEDTGKPTGEKEYGEYSATIEQNYKFNIDKIKWKDDVNTTEFKNKLGEKDGGITCIVKLYAKNGTLIDTYETPGKVQGDYVVANSDSVSFSQLNSLHRNDPEYVTVDMRVTLTYDGNDVTYYVGSNKVPLNYTTG